MSDDTIITPPTTPTDNVVSFGKRFTPQVAPKWNITYIEDKDSNGFVEVSGYLVSMLPVVMLSSTSGKAEGYADITYVLPYERLVGMTRA